jgi:hypothetical protein
MAKLEFILYDNAENTVAEVCREPINIIIQEPRSRELTELKCFDEEHTISDVLRYAIDCADMAEVRTLLEIMQNGDQSP